MAPLKRYPLPYLEVKKLVHAVITGNLQGVQEIVPEEVDVNQAITPYPGGVSTYLSFLAVDHNRPGVLRYLMGVGLDATVKDHGGMNLFCKVASMPHASKELTDILFNETNSPLSNLLNDQTAAGNTTVHLAVHNLYTLAAAMGMSTDLRVATVRNNNGDTPLAFAIKSARGNPVAASMLVKYAKEVSHEPFSTTDKGGYTALELAKMYDLPSLVGEITSSPRPPPLVSMPATAAVVPTKMTPVASEDEEEEGGDTDTESLAYDYEKGELGRPLSDNEKNVFEVSPSTDTGSTIVGLAREISTLTQRIDELEEINEKLRSQLLADQFAKLNILSLEDCEKKVDRTRELMIEQMDSDKARLEDSINQKDAQIEELGARLADLSGLDLDGSRTSTLKRDNDALRERLDFVMLANTDLEEKNSRLQETNSALEEKLTAVEQAAKSLEDRLRDANRAKFEIERVQLANLEQNEANLAEAARENNDLERRFVEANDELTRVMEEASVLSGEKARLLERIRTARDAITDLQNKLAEAERTKLDLERVNAAQAESVRDLKMEAEQRDDKIKKSQEKTLEAINLIEDLNAKVGKLREEKTNLEDIIADQEDFIEAIRKETDKELADMLSQAETAREANRKFAADTKAEVAALKLEAVATKRDLDDRAIRIENLETIVTARDKTITDLKKQLETELAATRAGHESQIAILTLEVASIKEDRNKKVRALKDRVDKLTSEVASANEKKAELEKGITFIEVDMQTLKEEVARYKKDAKDATEELANFQSYATIENEKHTSKVQSMERRIKTCNTSKMALTTANNQLEEDKKKMSEAMVALTSKQKELEKRVLDITRECTENIEKKEEYYNEQLAVMTRERANKDEMIKRQIESIVVKHKEELAVTEREYEELLKDHEAKFKATMREIERDHKTAIDELKKTQTEELDKMYAAYESELTSNKRYRIMKENRQLKQRIEDIDDTIDKRLRAAEVKHQEQLHRVLDDLNKSKQEVKRLTRELNQKRDIDEIAEMLQSCQSDDNLMMQS